MALGSFPIMKSDAEEKEEERMKLYVLDKQKNNKALRLELSVNKLMATYTLEICCLNFPD